MDKKLEDYVRSALRGEEVARLMRQSTELRRLVGRLRDEIYRLSGELDAYNDGNMFQVRAEGEVRLIRACDILFFEAQGRKIALRTEAQEICFYSNFKQVLLRLPDFFRRCHKGYIVNTRKIKSINFNQSVIHMNEGSAVPFSRSYREEVQGILADIAYQKKT
jgi:DNA-binding LytR/AlgR family response regulator